MSATVRKFIPRAPRYTLRPTDNRMVRFAHEAEKGQSYWTKVVDISMTGMSFVVERENAPFMFDQIKVEIPLDDGQQIAWWGKVVRMEEYATHKWYLNPSDFKSDEQILIAVKFEGLPAAQANAIRVALEKKFAEVEADTRRRWRKQVAMLWSHYTWEFLFYVAVVLAGVSILWALSRPTATYSADKGSPWGQRLWYIDSDQL